MGTKDGTTPDVPQVFDEPPPPGTGVPVERDPVTGRRLTGTPGGRQDKGRSAGRIGRLPLLVGAAVILIAGATIATVAVVRGSDTEPSAAQGSATDGAAEGETEGGESEPSTDASEEPPADTGPREVTIEITFTGVETAPDRAPAPGAPAVGDTRTVTWILTGACDGQGPCSIQECIEENTCPRAAEFTPTGSGYTGTFEFSWFGNPWPECGAVRALTEFTLTEGTDGPELAGTIDQTTGATLGYDGETSFCYIELYDSSFVSV